MALVVALSILVVVSVLVLGFFELSTSSLRLQTSRSHHTTADILAQSAGDYAIGQFLQEIAATANNAKVESQTGEFTFYKPLAKYMVPQRYIGSALLADDSASSIDPTVTVFSNLIRQSVPAGANPAPTGVTADNNVSQDRTDTPAANGRFVSTTRWNLPALNFDQGFTKGEELPYWIYLDWTTGATATPSLSGKSTTIGRFAYNVYNTSGLLDINAAGYNPTYVTSASNIGSLKGSLAGADLTKLPKITAADIAALIAIRNPGATTAATSIGNSNANVASGFMGSYVTDPISTDATFNQSFTNNYFMSRQELLKFANTQASGDWAPVLPYLTTFSRAINAPSWMPTTPAGSNLDYASLADTEDGGTALPVPPNRNCAAVRFSTGGTITHYHDDSTSETYTANAGDPLLQHRFSLARINWLTHTGPGATYAQAAAAIQSCFGLTWVKANADATNIYPHWLYVGGNTSGAAATVIETLDKVAAEKREPNFFEMLKAAILYDSLGRDPGIGAYKGGVGAAPVYDGVEGTGFEGYSSYNDMQVLQIGANIIDQYDTDDYPTAIYAPGIMPTDGTSGMPYMQTVYGIENLPYIFGFCNIDAYYQGAGNRLGGWLQPVIWNPHAQPENTATLPTQYQLRAIGQCLDEWSVRDTAKDNYAWWDSHVPNGGYVSSLVTPNPITVTFTATTLPQVYSNPLPLNANVAGSSDSNNLLQGYDYSGIPGTTTPYAVGFFCGSPTQTVYTAANYDTTAPAGDPNYATQTPPNSSPIPIQYATWAPQVLIKYDMTFVMDYLDPATGNFLPYTHLARLSQDDVPFYPAYHNPAQPYIAGEQNPSPKYTNNPTANSWSASAILGNLYGALAEVRPDPRTDRFSSALTSGSWMNQSLYPYYVSGSNNGDTHYTDKYTPRRSSNFTYVNPVFPNVFMADLFQNMASGSLSSVPMYYTDKDGVVRPADGARASPTATAGDGCPIFDAINNAGGTIGNGINDPRRPVVLNRAFQSVAEMGYAFRDQPFASVNFAPATNSYDSGDAGMLDLFSLQDGDVSNGSVTATTVTAGAINPNCASATVLNTLLSGTLDSDNGDSQIPVAALTAAAASSEATALVNTIKTTPLLSRADLAYDLAQAVIHNGGSSKEIADKQYREAPLRSLVSCADTRTWDLLIDVIAQAGHFPHDGSGTVSGTNASQFIVEGEKRYWLHVAIDRFTGKVVAQSLESVDE